MKQSEACLDIGMNLFVIDSSDVEKELLSFATSIFGSGRGSTLWINGKKGSDGKWYTYGPEKNRLMNGIGGVTDVESEENVDETIESNEETTSNSLDNSNLEDTTLSDTDDISDETAEENMNELRKLYQLAYQQQFYKNSRAKRSPSWDFDYDCLILSAFGPFRVSKTSCDKSMYSFCEYKKSGSDTPKQKLSTTTTSTTTSATTTYETEPETKLEGLIKWSEEYYYEDSFEASYDGAAW